LLGRHLWRTTNKKIAFFYQKICIKILAVNVFYFWSSKPWIRIGIQPKMLDLDPELMNSDPKHSLEPIIRLMRQSLYLGGKAPVLQFRPSGPQKQRLKARAMTSSSRLRSRPLKRKSSVIGQKRGPSFYPLHLIWKEMHML
jgi:hypothetical protein